MSDTWQASFGDLDFSPAAQHGDVTVEVHGLQRGKHTRITAVADSLIQDGSIERVVRDDNRDVQLVLCLDGTDSDALAQYEATLFREVNRGRNEFRWTPPDGFGATAVFDVLWADLAFADEGNVWDLDEIRGRRNYVLTMRCLPFARSVEPFTAAGVTSGVTPVTTTINDATTATGWFGVPTGGSSRYTPDLVSGHVSVTTYTGTTKLPALAYAPAAPVSMSGTLYFAVYWRTSSVFPHSATGLTVTADGAPLARVSAQYLGGAGVYGTFKTVFLCPDTSVAEFLIRPPRMTGYVGGATSGDFRVDKIEKTNQAPSMGTLRQKMTAIEVPGSARTPASLEVGHATSGLGHVLVYTGPTLASGYSPALSTFRVSSPTSDSTMVSGGRTGATTYRVPAALLPGGNYQLVVRANKAYRANEVVLEVAGVDVAANPPGVTPATILSGDGTGYYIQSLGTFNLPPSEVPIGSAATVRLLIDSTETSHQLDEAWLFYMPDDGSAHLSAVNAGTNKRIWLDTPSIDHPYPACYVGNAADRSDAYGVNGATSNWDEHVFPAGSNEVFVVTTTALDAQVELEGHARWLTHPAA